MSRAPAGDGGLPVLLRRGVLHGVVGAELLDESRNRHFEVFNEEAPENRTLPSSQSVRYML